MKEFMIAKANIKKNISSSITLLILIMAASLLMYTGSNVLFSLGHFVTQKNDSLNGADFTAFVAVGDQDKALDIIHSLEGVTEIEQEPSVSIQGTSIRNLTKDDKAQTLGCVFFNVKNAGEISKLEIIDEGTTSKKDAIILPLYLKIAYDYETGDTIEIKSSINTYQYTVYGFTEDINFANPVNSFCFKCFLYDDAYQEIAQKEAENAARQCIKVKLEKGIDTEKYELDFLTHITFDNTVQTERITTLNRDVMQDGLSATINIFMVLLILFAVIIIIIAMVIIRFTIVTHIEENMKNIGSMQSMGYTNRQMMAALLIQFLSIAVVGFLLGYALNFAAGVFIKQIVSVSIGLQWKNQFSLSALVISFVMIVAMVTLISLQTSRKIKKITPIVAIRNGINTHNFKKNYLPMDKTPLSLDTMIGFKGMLQNRKQNITLGFISLLISFAMVFTTTSYYNFITDNTAFLRLLGIEKSQITVLCQPQDYTNTLEAIQKMPEVYKTSLLDEEQVRVQYKDKDTSVATKICDDYNKLEIRTIIEGKYPEFSNEISLSNRIAGMIGAEIGDVVTVSYGDTSVDYLLVGISQHISYMGKSACMTKEGFIQLNQYYQPSRIYVYLKDESQAAQVIDQMKEKFRGIPLIYQNVDETFDAMLTTTNEAIQLLCVVFGIVTAGVIILTLYYLVKVKLIRDKLLLGIHKALGFTTKQLMQHLILSFCPVIAIGALLGSILGKLTINDAFAMTLSISGVKNGNLIIPLPLIFISFFTIVILALITTTIGALRIRKIRPRELFLQ